MIRYTFFLLLYLQIYKVSAHEFLTEILVYPEDTIFVSPHSTYAVIDTIYLSEEDLNKAINKQLIKQEMKRIVAKRNKDVPRISVVCDDWEGVFRTCGEFDDWNKGRTLAIDLCAGVAVNHMGLYPDGLIPQFIGPASFVDPETAGDDHHNAYSFSEGLVFNCVEVIGLLDTF